MDLEYEIRMSDEALKHIAYFKYIADKALINKIERLLYELKMHPRTGTGQCEQLKYDLKGFWSRRINREHRLIYQIDEKRHIVYIYKLRGHY